MAGRVREWHSNRLSDKLGTIRDLSGGEELDVTKFHNAIAGACRKLIPLRPPAATRTTHGFIRRMLQHELDMVDTGGSRVDAVKPVAVSAGFTRTRYQRGQAVPAGRYEMTKSLSELEARVEASTVGAGAGIGASDRLAARAGRASIEARDDKGVRSSELMRALG